MGPNACRISCRTLVRSQSGTWCGLALFDRRSVALSLCDSASRRTLQERFEPVALGPAADEHASIVRAGPREGEGNP